MTTKKVPLVVWEEGKKKPIGEAVVDIGDGFVDITGTITDEKYLKVLASESLSISVGPFNQVSEATVQPRTLSARVPLVVDHPLYDYQKKAEDGAKDGSVRGPSRKQRRQDRKANRPHDR